MSLATFFTRSNSQQNSGNQQQQNPQQHQHQQQQVQNNNNGNQNLPNNNGNPGPGNTGNPNPNEPKNPLDVYGKMFDNTPTEADKPPTFSIDPKVMDQVVQGQDFMSGADPELVKKATSGDVESLMSLIRHASGQAYRAAIEHGGVLTDKFVGSYSNYQGKQLPNVLKGHLTEQQLAANTPNFKHPVVKKQLTEIAKRLQSQHPDAQPHEIAQMSKDYLTELMQAITPEDPNKATNQQQGEQDWDKYFD